MTIAGTSRPEGWRKFPIAVTLPEIDAWTGADTAPCASPIFRPFRTTSPIATTGLAVAPVCWTIGTTTRAGSGISSV